MHTGTHIVRNILLRGEKINGFHIPELERRVQGCLDSMDGLVVSPLRHPARVAESFKRRGSDVERFFLQWSHFMRYFAPRVDLYIHVDHPCRDSEVESLADLLGKPISYDWAVTVESGSRQDTHALDIQNCTIEIPDSFSEFYGQTLPVGFRGA